MHNALLSHFLSQVDAYTAEWRGHQELCKRWKEPASPSHHIEIYPPSTYNEPLNEQEKIMLH